MKLDNEVVGRNALSESETPANESANLLAALWRYRWGVIIPTVASLIIGFIIHARLPERYRSSARLMVESDQPKVLDQVTGGVYGGVPSIDLVRSQLYSDKVLTMAFESTHFEPFRELFDNRPENFIASAPGKLTLQPDAKNGRQLSAFVASLSYEDANPGLCRAAVESFSEAMQKFFNQRQKDSRGNLIHLLSTAMDELLPKMEELEEKHRKFRDEAPLEWDAEDVAINPHRERQLFLASKRSELAEDYRRLAAELTSVQGLAANTTGDPLLALDIVGQLLGKQFVLPSPETTQPESMQEEDNKLQLIEVDQQLVPLIIEANRYEAEYGANHPTVKALRSEIVTMKAELKRLVEEENKRVVELLELERKNRRVDDPVKRAREAVNAVVYAIKAQKELMKQQIAEIDRQIGVEKVQAVKMSRFEQENKAQMREIERTRGLLSQLEEQMARVSLLEEEGGTEVIELKAPSKAFPVGSSLTKVLGQAGVLGFLLGAALAILLEKNANTFRDPDEVSALLGVPVLTHVPFFKGKVARRKKGESYQHDKLDPYLTTVHTPNSVAAEAIRSCRTSLFFETANIKGGRVIQITSPLPGDGKSTIAGNLACSIAQSGKRVLAIDCDLRRPQLTDNFALESTIGLTNVLNGECDPVDASHETSLKNLWVMPSGPIPVNPAEALTLPDMAELLELLREQYDYVILDTPPLLVVTDPSITASLADGVVMALRIRRKSKPNAKESIGILKSVNAKIFGLVINNSDEASASDGYRGYGYYRYGRYTSRYERKAGDGSGKSGQRTEPMLVSGRKASPLPLKQPAPSRPADPVTVHEDVTVHEELDPFLFSHDSEG